MSREPFARRVAGAAAGLCLVAGLAGCGGGSSGQSAKPTVGKNYCQLGAVVQDRIARLVGQGISDGAKARALLSETASALKDAGDVAPSEIKADLQAAASAADRFASALKKAGDDPAKVPADVTTQLQVVAKGPIGDHLQAYYKAHCTPG